MRERIVALSHDGARDDDAECERRDEHVAPPAAHMDAHVRDALASDELPRKRIADVGSAKRHQSPDPVDRAGRHLEVAARRRIGSGGGQLHRYADVGCVHGVAAPADEHDPRQQQSRTAPARCRRPGTRIA